MSAKDQLKSGVLTAFIVICIMTLTLIWGGNKIDNSEKWSWIINDLTNPYLTDAQIQLLTKEEKEIWEMNQMSAIELAQYEMWKESGGKEGKHPKPQNFTIGQGGKIAPLTVLTPEEMKVQEERGCTACHTR